MDGTLWLWFLLRRGVDRYRHLGSRPCNRKPTRRRRQLGPVDLTNGTVTNASAVPDDLLRRGQISEEVIRIYYVQVFEPNNDGALTFGGH